MANKNFVVKNGLEVNENLIFARDFDNRVGVGTTNPLYRLDVNGGIGATDLNITRNSIVAGVSTVNNIRIDGRLSAGSSLGSAGQYLVSTGTGVTWKSNVTERTSVTFTASELQTTFLTPYTPNLMDVFINGVKLSSNEYDASDGESIILNDSCFGGETVEIISINSDENYFGGYFNVESSAPINISYSNNVITISVSGIGSTSFTLF
jgi:hypothetical protein